MKNFFLFLSFFIGLSKIFYVKNVFAEPLHILAPMRTLDPKLIEQFERENNCEVKVDFVVDDRGYEPQLRSDLKIFDLVVADEKSLMNLTTANLLKFLPESIQQPNSSQTVFQTKTSLNTEVNTYVPLFVNPLGIVYKPHLSHIKADLSWQNLLDFNLNPYWRQHLYISNDPALLISLGFLISNEPPKNSKVLPNSVLQWLKNVNSQRALINEPLSFTLNSNQVNVAVLFYKEYLHYKEYMKELDFRIPSDGTYFDRIGIAWYLSSTQEELSKKFIKFIVDNSDKFSEYNQLFNVNTHFDNNPHQIIRFFKNSNTYSKPINIQNWKLYEESLVLPFVSKYQTKI